MAPFTAWLPARPNQDFDLIIKIVGVAASGLMKDWTFIAQSLIRKGFWVMTQRERLSGDFGDFVLTIRLATRPFYSMGHGCDVLVHLGETTRASWNFGLQPGSVLLWEPSVEQRRPPTLPEGVIAYPVPLTHLCVQKGEGVAGKGLVALGALLHLLGVPEATLYRWTPMLSSPRSFATGHDYARHDLKKHDAYSLPSATADAEHGLLLNSEQAILLGYAVSACECQRTCDAELIDSPRRWTNKHLGMAGAVVSVLESERHPGVQAYRGPQGKVTALLRGDDPAIASFLSGFKAPHVFVAAEIADAFGLLIRGHDLIRSGLSDGVGILIEETIALQHQTVHARFMADMMRRGHAVTPSPATGLEHGPCISTARRDGDEEADVGFVAWGAAQGVVRDAVALCRSFGLRVAGLYPKRLMPFCHEDMTSFAKTVGHVVVVESGQTQGYWDRLRPGFSFDYTVLSPLPGESLTPMDIYLREGLGAA